MELEVEEWRGVAQLLKQSHTNSLQNSGKFLQFLLHWLVCHLVNVIHCCFNTVAGTTALPFHSSLEICRETHCACAVAAYQTRRSVVPASNVVSLFRLALTSSMRSWALLLSNSLVETCFSSSSWSPVSAMPLKIMQIFGMQRSTCREAERDDYSSAHIYSSMMGIPPFDEMKLLLRVSLVSNSRALWGFREKFIIIFAYLEHHIRGVLPHF